MPSLFDQIEALERLAELSKALKRWNTEHSLLKARSVAQALVKIASWCVTVPRDLQENYIFSLVGADSAETCFVACG